MVSLSNLRLVFVLVPLEITNSPLPTNEVQPSSPRSPQGAGAVKCPTSLQTEEPPLTQASNMPEVAPLQISARKLN